MGKCFRKDKNKELKGAAVCLFSSRSCVLVLLFNCFTLPICRRRFARWSQSLVNGRGDVRSPWGSVCVGGTRVRWVHSKTPTGCLSLSATGHLSIVPMSPILSIPCRQKKQRRMFSGWGEMVGRGKRIVWELLQNWQESHTSPHSPQESHTYKREPHLHTLLPSFIIHSLIILGKLWFHERNSESVENCCP